MPTMRLRVTANEEAFLPQFFPQRLVFGDMAIYTTCKNSTFNGMPLPDIWVLREDETLERLRKFGYQDFKDRLGRVRLVKVDL